MERLRARMASLPAIRFQVYFHMFIVHIYYPMRRIYDQRYAEPPGDGGRLEATRTATAPTQLESGQQSAPGLGATTGVEWQWKGLPKLWLLMTWYRWASSIWMIYAIVKYSVPGPLEWLIDSLGLSKPANCYLIGRFQLVDEVERVTAILFASYHIIWRYFQLYRYNPMNIGAIYFLILDHRDTAQYYKLLAREQQLQTRQDETRHAMLYEATGGGGGGGGSPFDQELEPPDGESLLDEELLPETPLLVETTGRERFMHEVMSYAVFRGSRRINRLRPNRTPEASRHLRSYLINANIIGLLIFTPIALAIALAITLQVLNDKRYLAEYRGCVEELAQMERRGELAKWSVHFGAHQSFAYLADLLENYFLWTESGIVCFFSPILNLVVNRDLMVYWEHLNGKIEATLAVLRERQSQLVNPRQQFQMDHHQASLRAVGPSSQPRPQELLAQARRFSVQVVPGRRFENDLEELIQDIQSEFEDFIMQIRQASHFIGELTTMLLSVWFTLFAFFTYTQQTQLMPALKATLICVGLILTALFLSVLQLHRNSLKAYPKICSLMALDTSERKKHFIGILDYYVRKRTCYKFYRRVPMTGIQYLTYVGWSLSCLFLVLNRR